MCELLGISSKRKKDRTRILREFYSHAEEHPHGWGLARLDGESPIIEKEPFKATASEALMNILADGVEAQTLIAHIRLATIGNLEYSNCHPFTARDNSGRTWTLAHNGTMFRGEELNRYYSVQFGETDSERVLLHIISLVDEAQRRLERALNGQERFGLLETIVSRLAKGNKLNLLIHDGEVMYAHSNFRGALHCRKDEDSLAFSTKPLSEGDWTPLPFTRLVAAKDGEIVREGASHGNEYIYNPDDYRCLFMDFARL